MARPKIGKAKFGNKQKTFEKIKDGEQVYGILPPLGDLANEGRWSVYYSVHYGYKNPAGKSRGFQSCEVKSRKPPYMVEVADAATERLNMLKGKLEKAKAAKDEKAKEAILKLYGGAKSLYNIDKNHYMNAIDLEGNIVVLKLRHKCKVALDQEIDKLRKKGIEPLGVENRRFFVFTRTGMGNETAYKVSVYKKTVSALVNGQTAEVEQDYAFTLTDEILDRLGDEAGKLDQLFKFPTPEQVERIVKESNLTTGISPNIDEILGFSDKNAVASTDEVYEDSEDEVENSVAPAITAAINSTVVASSGVVDTAPTQTTIAPTVTVSAPTAKVSAAQTTSDKITEMSDEAFLKSMGIG